MGLKKLANLQSGAMSEREHEVATGKRESNTLFARSDPAFLSTCKSLYIEPTIRQASKWRNRRGIAYQCAH